MHFRIFSLLMALFLVLGLAGCDDDDDGGTAADASPDRTSDRGTDTSAPDLVADTGQPDAVVDTSTPDTSVPDAVTDTGGGCGAIDYLGTCEGDEAVWCDDGELARVDCADRYPEGVDGTCIHVDDEDWGYWCAVEAGGACYYESGPEFCHGTNPGCVIGTESSMCTDNVGPCTMTDSSTAASAETCLGQVLVLNCLWGQPFGIDCTAYTGTCNETSEACIDITAGNPCDDDGDTTDDYEPILLCAAGLTCEGVTADSYGTCTAGE